MPKMERGIPFLRVKVRRKYGNENEPILKNWEIILFELAKKWNGLFRMPFPNRKN